MKRCFDYSDEHFDLIRKTVFDVAGISLSTEKKSMVYGRLSRRLRALSMSDFESYCDHIMQNEDELFNMIDAITTNVTQFFREKHHFEFMKETAIPEIIATKKSKHLQVWCAACSTGQEPYSIAMSLLSMPSLQDWRISIVASDINKKVMDHARKGLYSMDNAREIPLAMQHKWCDRNLSDNTVQMKKEVLDCVNFKKINLLDCMKFAGRYDMIYCRNVMIYFEKNIQKDIVEKFSSCLNPPGYLFIGHAENILSISDKYNLVGKTVYKLK